MSLWAWYRTGLIGDWQTARAFATGPGVVQPGETVFGHATERFSPPAYGDYLATSANVYVCANTRAKLLSSLPLQLIRLQRGGKQVTVTRGEAFDLLGKVNPFWTFRRLIEMTELSLCLWGKAYWFVERGASGAATPRELWWARPDQVRVVPDTRDYISHFLFKPRNGAPDIRYERSEVIWLRYPNPLDQYDGLSPIAAARLAADTASAAAQSNRNLFVNGIQAGGFISPKAGQTFSKEQQDQIEGSLNRRFKGVNQAHKWGVFRAEVGMTSAAMSPKDAEFLGSLNWSKEEIATVYGIPIDLIGGKRTYQNREESERAIWTDTMRPEALFIADELTEQLLPMFPGQADLAAFDFSGVEALHEQETARWTRNQGMIQAGRKTINEVREEDGDDPLPWGDVWWAPINLVPVARETDPPEPTIITEQDGDAARALAAAFGLPMLPARSLRATRTIEYGSTEHVQLMRRFDRLLAPHERKIASTTTDLFRRQRQAVLDRLTGDRSVRVAEPAADEPFDHPRWIKAFREAIRPVFLALVDDAGQAAVDDLALSLSFKVSDPNVIRFLERKSQNYAKHINETTYAQLKEALAEGIQAGEGIDPLADRVRAVMGGRIGDAELIARTESTASGNGGTMLSWEQSGVVTEKRWLATLDSRVRPSHRAAHGQTVALDADFHVGGATGPSPGNLNQADEDARCRCSMTAVLDTDRTIHRNGHKPAEFVGVIG